MLPLGSGSGCCRHGRTVGNPIATVPGDGEVVAFTIIPMQHPVEQTHADWKERGLPIALEADGDGFPILPSPSIPTAIACACSRRRLT